MNPTFRKLAPRIAKDLRRDFPEWDTLDICAVLGNAGHESGGFAKLQEIAPTVKGSRGGWGWFQWTGPRRRKFEAWASEKGFAFDSYEANYGFLVRELRGSEKSAVAKTAAAAGLRAKVEAFEMAYERAGVKHYDSRHKWALAAWDLLKTDDKPKPAAKPIPVIPVGQPDDPGPDPAAPPASDAWWKRSPILRSIGQGAAWLGAGGSALLAADWRVIAVLSIVGLALAVLALRYQTRAK